MLRPPAWLKCFVEGAVLFLAGLSAIAFCWVFGPWIEPVLKWLWIW